MVDRATARALVVGRLAAMPAPAPDDIWVVLDEHTIERDWGWVVFYDSRRHQETGDFRFAVAGTPRFSSGGPTGSY